MRPSAAEVEYHRSTGHAVYRSWCRDCIRGRCQDLPHFRIDRSEDTTPLVLYDYAFLRSPSLGLDTPEEEAAAEREGSSPVLVGWDSMYKRLWCHLLPAKGTDFGLYDEVVKMLAADLKGSGHQRIRLRTDGESSLQALMRDVLKEWGGEVIIERSAPGDWKSHGGVESAVKTMKGLVRTNLMALEGKLGCTVPADHPIMSFLVRYASLSHYHYVAGDDNRTARQRVLGIGSRPSSTLAAEFGEKVEWQPLTPAGRLAPLAPRSEEGYYVGAANDTNEVYILTPTGLIRTRAFKRLPEEEKWDAAILNIQVSWLQPNLLNPGERRIPIRAPVHRPDVRPEEPAPPPARPGAPVKRVQFTKEIIDKYRPTKGCSGCQAATDGTPHRQHTERCRNRIEELMREDPVDRVKVEEAARRFAAHAERLAQAPDAGGQARGSGTHEAEPLQKKTRLHADASDDQPTPAPAGTSASPSSTSAPAVEGGTSASSSSTSPAPHLDAGSETAEPEGIEEPEAKRRRQQDLALLDLLLVHGGDSWIKEPGKKNAGSANPGIAEVYSPPRIVPIAANAGLGEGFSLDLDTGWDFDKPSDRAKAKQMVTDRRPLLLVLSPMCTYFSSIQRLSQNRRDPHEFDANLARAVRHLMFSLELCRIQRDAGRHFLLEHPAGASSWQHPEVVKFIAETEKLFLTTGHMCQFGMVATDSDGVEKPVAKNTRWMTSSECLGTALGAKCPRNHQHCLLEGKAKACRMAQVYPPALCEAIVRAFSTQIEDDSRADSQRNLPPLNAYDRELDLIELWKDDVEDHFEHADVGLGALCTRSDDDDGEGGDTASDDVKGGPLPVALVKKARETEIQYLMKREVYRVAQKEEARKAGKRVLRLKWIDTDKGDMSARNVRSRLVCTEVRRRGSDAIFAATPPLDSMKAILTKAASRTGRKGRALVLQLVDVSRAHFYAPAVRDVYIQLPAEDPRSNSPALCGKLNRTMYGTLDAAEQWALHYAATLEAAGFVKGSASPCHFYHPLRDLWIVVHGDDFFSVGEEEDQDYLREALATPYEIKTKRASADGPNKSLRVLGRMISFTEEGLQVEADPQHAETAAAEVGLTEAKAVASPIAAEEAQVSAAALKAVRLQLQAGSGAPEEPSPPLTEEDSRKFMSVAARLNFLAGDRPDCQYAVKELMRKMNRATESDMVALKRVIRYLLSAPRCVCIIPWQRLPSAVKVHVDANWAGCRRTRKSTLGGVITFGTVPVKTWSKTMPILALSSGESELAALVKGAGEGLGFVSSLADFGLTPSLELHSDATAAIGIAKREGLGRVRHLATADLWIQQLIRQRRLRVFKCPGTHNPSDLMTKGLSRDRIQHLLQLMYYQWQGGRAPEAPIRQNTTPFYQPVPVEPEESDAE